MVSIYFLVPLGQLFLAHRRVNYPLAKLGQFRCFLVVVFIDVPAFDEVDFLVQLLLDVFVHIEMRKSEEEVEDIEEEARNLNQRRPEISAVRVSLVQHMH